MKAPIALVVAAAAALAGGTAVADPVAVEILVKPQEQVKFQFGDGSKHFVLAVRREGTAEGSGAFAGARVTEVGWHDVNPPVSGAPRGYLQLTAENGDVAVLRWRVSAVFVKDEEGMALLDHGVWEMVSGTGRFADMHGVGTIVIKPRGGPTLFILDGEIGEKA